MAGEAAAEEVDRGGAGGVAVSAEELGLGALSDSGADVAHVVEDGDAGEAVSEHAPSERLELALPEDAVSGALEPEVEASNSAEKRSNAERSAPGSQTAISRSLIGFAASIGRSSTFTVGVA